jgi:23S rRNA pseudouridine1911/1915/1917 synthase
MEIEVLYEDHETLVINKPVGLVVNRADSVKETTLQDWIEKNYQFSNSSFKLDKLFVDRSGLCHRLDKETSGCLMIAKTPEALRYYLKMFKERKLTKEYVALVHGKVEPDEGTIILPLKRSQFDREKWQVHYEGKKAITLWKVLKRFSYPNSEHWSNSLTYLRLNLKTGRTHQIRVHLSFLGWPIFSDEKYLNKELENRDRTLLNHHFLHAERLSFKSFSGADVKVVASLPPDNEMLLKNIVSD